MEPSTGYATSFDQTKIYYEVYGQGPVICCCNGIGVSTFFWKYLVEFFSSNYRVILWDYRSHGKSGPAPDYNRLTMKTNAMDLAAVLDAVGADKAVLAGHSMGVQTIFEFYRLYRERTAALIPVLGAYGHPMNSFLNTDIVAKLFPYTYQFSTLFPGLTQKIAQSVLRVALKDEVANAGARLVRFIHWQFFQKQDLMPYMAHLRTLDVNMFLSMAKRMQEHTVKDMLPLIEVPVLVVSAQHDLFTPWRISKTMQELIPNAEILTIPFGSHAALVEQPELMNLRIEKFILARLSKSSWAKAPKKLPTGQRAAKKKLAGPVSLQKAAAA
ncbi:MAG: alpha/beta hydrolase [Desulfatibacillaceae bacterium]|nr:alpha/beta hydrolase [Desulfatibacillaceae bacterium]